MNHNGIAWSLDAIVAGVISLSAVALLFSTASHEALDRAQRMQENALELASLNWSDAIVKQRDDRNPLFGAAHYSEEKKRVESHWIELGLLQKAFPERRGKFYLAALSIQSNGKETIFWSHAMSGSCVARNRFAMVWETKQKALLHAVVCSEP